MVQNQTPIKFTGKAGEYFGIWIVNLLLSIVTLGIYSAWAKVRRKKYFYNNTLIEGVGFDYHANPIAILKGRVIAFIAYIAFLASAKLSLVLYGILFIVFIIALPWIIVRGMTFNARNSSHRGLRFDFDGTYGQAALVFLAFPLLIVVTLGLALPFVAQRSHKFIVDHHKFGTSHFDMQASVKAFYMIYLKLLGAVILIALLIGAGVSVLTIGSRALHAQLDTPIAKHVVYQPQQQTGFIKVADTTENVPADAMAVEGMPAEELAAEEPVAAGGEPQSMEDMMKDMSPEERAEFEKIMKEFGAPTDEAGTTEPAKPANPLEKLFDTYAMLGPIIYVFFLLGIVLYAAVIFIFVAYIQSRISNLMWNNTKLEHVGFFSNQRMRDLVWLYLSNIVVLVITLGLATPWAQIRMARYRISHLAITGETDWDQFVGEKKDASRALGEEIANMFDVDLSFG